MAGPLPSRPAATLLLGLAAALSTGAAARAHDDHAHGDHGTPPAALGSVHFPVSCSAPAQAAFDRGMALQHSFWYQAAQTAFAAVLAADPGCAMAQWGIALSLLYNPFSPTPAKNLVDGAAALARARAIGLRTPREAGYIDALSVYFAETARPQPVRAKAYAEAMGALAARFPDDPEAAILHALALDVAAPPTDKSYAMQLQAAAILEAAFAAQPDHPGVTHYLIHSYDVPPLAARGLPAALRYAGIAAAAPHAQHMPSHIFTRVGYWRESIAANRRSAEIAARDSEPSDELHADDYLVYAHLQLAQDAAAAAILQGLPAAMARPGLKRNSLWFAAAAIPARLALEREDWAAAARLPLQPSDYAYADAITRFARALGAARSGDVAAARAEHAALAALGTGLADAYWAEQIAIQADIAAAWIAEAEARPDALDLMRAAAAREDRTEKHAITPGPLAPARELLGEMLLRHDRAAEALAVLEAAQRVEPNRFRGLALAARAAEAAGERERARAHHAALLVLAAEADAARPAIERARRYLGKS